RKVDTGFPPARSLASRLLFRLTLRRAKPGRERSCSNNKLKRNAESTQNHFALASNERRTKRAQEPPNPANLAKSDGNTRYARPSPDASAAQSPEEAALSNQLRRLASVSWISIL